MSDSNKPVKWWYFVWEDRAAGSLLKGTNILPLVDEEFNFLAAHNWIEKTEGTSAIITFYRQVNVDQVAQYKLYCDKVNKENPQAPRKTQLSVLKGGK